MAVIGVKSCKLNKHESIYNCWGAKPPFVHKTHDVYIPDTYVYISQIYGGCSEIIETLGKKEKPLKFYQNVNQDTIY